MLAACATTPGQTDRTASAAAWPATIADLLLGHIAVEGGATQSEVLRDLAPMAAHRLSPSEFRAALDAALDAIARDGFAREQRGRIQPTALGLEQAQTRLGWRTCPANWPQVRDTHLTALALGLTEAPQTRIALLARPDGLRAAILQTHFGLKLRRTPTLSRIRAELAGVALKQAFANTLPDGLDLRGGMTARASRQLAAHLSRTPRDFGSDSRLIAALAAEVVEAPQTDVTSLRLAVFRRYVSARFAQLSGSVAPEPEQCAALPDHLSHRPDMETFVAAVLECAAMVAEAAADDTKGASPAWAGSRKALIADVFESIQLRHPAWQLSDVEFKGMLSEAHRSGHLQLANADLRTKATAAALQRSAVSFKNTVWHFVRLAPAPARPAVARMPANAPGNIAT